MNSTLKKKFSLIALLLCCMTIVSCNHSKVNNTSTNTLDNIEKSLIPSQIPKESKDSNDSKEEKIDKIYGKWRVIERIGSGYAFTDIPEKSYIGGEITITDELVQCSMPDKELNYTIKNPKYVMQWQSRNDFYMEHYAQYDSFGFENPEKVPKIEIKKKGQSLGFGSTLWIKDENHIIIMGPQYFLAEKQSN